MQYHMRLTWEIELAMHGSWKLSLRTGGGGEYLHSIGDGTKWPAEPINSLGLEVSLTCHDKLANDLPTSPERQCQHDFEHLRAWTKMVDKRSFVETNTGNDRIRLAKKNEVDGIVRVRVSDPKRIILSSKWSPRQRDHNTNYALTTAWTRRLGLWQR